MKNENILGASQGFVVGAALGTAVLVHHCIASEGGPSTEPQPADTAVVCWETVDGSQYCNGTQIRGPQ